MTYAKFVNPPPSVPAELVEARMRGSFDWAQREKNSLIRRSGPLSCVRIVGQRIGVALYGVWSYAGFSISDFLPTCPNCGGVSEFDCQWKSRVASRG